jgi:hypothetical protein
MGALGSFTKKLVWRVMPVAAAISVKVAVEYFSSRFSSVSALSGATKAWI